MPDRAVLLAAALLLSAAPSYAADLAAGREKAKLCTACHGENGVSATPGIPSLAGQLDQFIQWQLVFFRSRRRANPLMAPLAGGLSDEDIRNLGAYFSSLPYSTKPATEHQDAALADQGRGIATLHHCAVCHMANFRGSGAAAAIADQREDYLVKALRDYRSGARPSTGVAAMNEAAAPLSDADIDAVANYLATMPAPQQQGHP